jgi:hypothetical protein
MGSGDLVPPSTGAGERGIGSSIRMEVSDVTPGGQSRSPIRKDIAPSLTGGRHGRVAADATSSIGFRGAPLTALLSLSAFSRRHPF